MRPLQSLQFLCFFLLLWISLAQEEDAELSVISIEEPYNPDVHYCSSDDYHHEEYCPYIYQPVCAKYRVFCFKAPCPPQEKDYPNVCTACQNPNVISYTIGECDKSPKEQFCKDDYPYPPYPCPNIYDPVCVTTIVECIQAPCPPIQQEYDNACMACNDDVSSYTQGPCEDDGNHEEEYENEEEYEEEEEIYEEIEYEEENEVKYCQINPGVTVLCLHDYIPVCGYWNDCTTHSPCYETFENSCVACYYGKADYYYEGVCPQNYSLSELKVEGLKGLDISKPVCYDYMR